MILRHVCARTHYACPSLLFPSASLFILKERGRYLKEQNEGTYIISVSVVEIVWVAPFSEHTGIVVLSSGPSLTVLIKAFEIKPESKSIIPLIYNDAHSRIGNLVLPRNSEHIR